jgi:hypothetical protein
MKSLFYVVLIFLNCYLLLHSEFLTGAEIPNLEDITESYENIVLVDEGDVILKDAHACLQAARECVAQLKNPSAGITSAISYVASYFYSTPSPDTMIERINTYLIQLEQLRENIAVMLRRATDIRSFEKSVESTVRENMNKIGEAAWTDPKKVYAYLLSPTGAESDEVVADYTKQGLAKSAAQIREIIKAQLEQASDARKKLLRQVGFLFRNDASKQEFDAYLTGTLATLILDEKLRAKLEEQYGEIIVLKAELDEQASLINKLKAKSG